MAKKQRRSTAKPWLERSEGAQAGKKIKKAG